jgi:hypothetical protein
MPLWTGQLLAYPTVQKTGATAVVHDRVATSLTELKSALHKNNGKDSHHKKAA